MIVALVGATGTGKSALGLDLAARLGARGLPVEIVNADAMQLYRGMDIGTAKLSPKQRAGVPHHLLDVLEVTDESTAARYQADARSVIDEIQQRGALPVMVGGSMLYLAAVLTDFQFPGTDPAVRARWEHQLEIEGIESVARELHAVDPVAANAIGPSNGRRIVRALEVIELTGQPFSVGLAARATPWRPYLQFGLRVERSVLVERLQARVAGMWADGLLEEVAGLVALGLERGPTASRAIGYAQALGQLRGQLSAEAAIAETTALTRRYARRQVSWFRRDESVQWIDAVNPQSAREVEDAVLHALDQAHR